MHLRLTTLAECAEIGTLSLSMLAPIGRYAVKAPRKLFNEVSICGA